MSKIQIIPVFLWLTVFFYCMPKVFAAFPTGIEAENLTLSEGSDLNFKSFEVNVQPRLPKLLPSNKALILNNLSFASSTC